MKNRYLFLAAFLVSFLLFSYPDNDKSITYLQTNLEYLASDELEGREVTTRGERLAAKFIASELEKYGVEPFGDSGGYFQYFDVKLTQINQSSEVSFTKENKTYPLIPKEDFFIDNRSLPLVTDNQNELDIVFVNYGIIADEYDHNDFTDINVENKAVLVLDDLPNEDDNYFDGEDDRKYGSWSYKRKTAQEQGAAAVIILQSDKYFDLWYRFSDRMFDESVSLTDGEQDQHIPLIALNRKAFEKLMEGEKYSFEKLLNKKENGENINSFELNAVLNFDISLNNSIEKAMNVVGIIHGNNRELDDTYVAVSAHYDHLGISNGVVYNGADDNGSGTVTILEAARILSEQKENNRSILFLFHTAEEKGLLGSRYLTANAPYVHGIIANINMDMVGRGPRDEIFCIGSGKISSQYYDLVREVNDRTVDFKLDYKFDELGDPNRYYYRSDHYQYAKRGIPVVFFFDEMKEDYHKPTDDVHKIDFHKLKNMAVLTAELALEASNLEKRLHIDN